MEELVSKWDEIKESLRIEYELTDIAYRTWIEPLKIGQIKNNTVYITITRELAPNIAMVNKKYRSPLKVYINEALSKSFEDQYDIEIISEDDIHKEEIHSKSYVDNQARYEKANLNLNYTFDTFVVGSNNRLAQASAIAVSEDPGKVYNPLFIYGGVGLGKTHLMHAIGHYIIDQNPDANVLYVTSEQFTNEVIEAVRTGNNNPEKIKQFRDKYRNIDVLLIDDIQFIIGKASTQEEFFHTFNHLYEQKKQIIITSDKPPKDMDVLEERFRSRFAWGLIADIQFPDYETRMAILQKKVEAFDYNISNDVLSYIANNVKSNIRELEGSIKKVVVLANLEKKVIDLDIAKEALKDIISPNSPSMISPENIMSVVCDHFNVSIEDIKSSKRNKELVYPRQVIMYLCRSMTGATYKEIASLLGGRDHSTIMYGERSISDMMEKDESTRRTIETIVNKLKSD